MKKLRCFYYIVTLFSLYSHYLMSQDLEIPSSPNVSSLIKNTNVPISLYNGTLNIEAPLIELPYSGGNGSIDIGLSYHGAGNKVHDIPGPCGLGWNFSANFSITRVVRGLPDDDINGFSGPNESGNKISRVYTTLLHQINDGVLDPEPDTYYYSIPGKNGKFVMDADRNIFPIPMEGAVQIEKVVTSTKDYNGGLIPDEYHWAMNYNGWYYEFNENEVTQATVINKDADGNDISKTTTYKSTWFLTSITKPDGNLAATFTYTSYNEINCQTFSGSTSFSLSANQDPLVQGLYSKTYDPIFIKVSNPKYLTSITTNLAKIDIGYDDRTDLVNGKKLSNVSVHDNNNILIKSFGLFYTYFIGQGAEKDRYRLRLDEIHQITNSTSNQYIKLYKFDYNTSINLPGISSKEFDHWGFYNKYAPIPYSKLSTFLLSLYSLKGPDKDRSLANILTSVTNATGGKTSFEYEIHTYIDKNGITNSAGGARLKKKTVDDGIGNVNFTIYEYILEDGSKTTSGRLFRIPKYDSRYTAYETVVDNGQGGVLPVYLLILQSQSASEIYDYNGSHIGYSCIITTDKDGSKQIYKYTNFDTNPDNAPEQMTFNESSDHEEFRTHITSDEYPYTPYSSLAVERGLLLEHKIIDKNGNILKKENNDYYLADPNVQTFQCLRITPPLDATDVPTYRYGYYSIILKSVRIASSIIENYGSYNKGVVQKNIENSIFSYNNDYQISKISKTYFGDNKTYLTKYKYPLDYKFSEISVLPPDFWQYVGNDLPEAIGVELLALKNQRLQPIEITKSFLLGENEYVTESSLTLFKNYYIYDRDFLNRSLPYKYLEFKSAGVKDFNSSSILHSLDQNQSNVYNSSFIYDPRYREKITNDVYGDSEAHVRQTTRNDGFKISYLWGYQNTYLVAEVKNATNSLGVKTEKILQSIGSVSTSLSYNSPSSSVSFHVDYLGPVNIYLSSPASSPYIVSVDGDCIQGEFDASNSKSYKVENVNPGDYTINFSINQNNAVNVSCGADFPKTEKLTTIEGLSEIYYESFESQQNFSNVKAHAGDHHSVITNYKPDFTIPNDKKYIIEYWYLDSQSHWNYKKKYFTNNMILNDGLAFDEIRIYPENAKMTTYTYKVLSGITSKTDENNNTIYYEYDDFQRLKYIRDHNGNIVKQNIYHYKGQ